MKITIKTESDPDIVSSPVICGISIDGVMSQNDVRDALSEIDKFAEMFFNKQIHKYGNEPDPHDFLANAKRDEPWEDQIANKAKTQVHALKNLAESGCDATADTKAENIYDLIDALVNQIKIQGVKEESNKAKERAVFKSMDDLAKAAFPNCKCNDVIQKYTYCKVVGKELYLKMIPGTNMVVQDVDTDKGIISSYSPGCEYNEWEICLITENEYEEKLKHVEGLNKFQEHKVSKDGIYTTFKRNNSFKIPELRKENHELKEWNDKLNECCNSLESEVQMLKAKIYDIQNKEK